MQRCRVQYFIGLVLSSIPSRFTEIGAFWSVYAVGNDEKIIVIKLTSLEVVQRLTVSSL